MKMKRCCTCKIKKSASSFYGNRSKRDGLQDDCKSCHDESGRAWRKTPAGKAYSKRNYDKWRKTPGGKVKYLASQSAGQVRYRAKHPKIIQARTKVNHAIQRGRLERQNCHCGQPAEAHITDLKNPLEGIKWLCPLHNRGVKSGALGVARNGK